jgi:signal peptidase I
VTATEVQVNQDEASAPRRRPLLRLAIPAVTLAVVLLAVFALEPFRVQSSSMTPTLDDGDQIIAEKLTPRFGELERGDVVVLAPPSSDALMVKRVVAVAGDRVGLADGLLVVNGRRVHESYVDQQSIDGAYFGPKVVPPGSVFVMGDDRADSVDSRRFGPVPVSRVVGRMVVRLW